MEKRAFILALFLAFTLSCGTIEDTGSDGLTSILWVQTSEEYRGLCLQSFDLAKSALKRNLSQTSYSAASEQAGQDGLQNLPPAIIVDIDETTLDNSPYQARLALEGETFSPESWKLWVMEKRADAIPGAIDFLSHADSSGVDVFYVTNRTHDLEEATRANLTSLGFPVRDKPDAILSKGEKPGWGSDKTSRRAEIAKSHRICLLIGDDLGDFANLSAGDTAARLAVAEKNQNQWGSGWIVLPNPLYGSFERSLLKGRTVETATEKLKLRRSYLRQ